jgi:hypothetical protein
MSVLYPPILHPQVMYVYMYVPGPRPKELKFQNIHSTCGFLIDQGYLQAIADIWHDAAVIIGPLRPEESHEHHHVSLQQHLSPTSKTISL